MSGHSHWAGIRHKKAAVDARRGKVFSKIVRDIVVAARNGGGNPEANITLKYALDKARQVNMPKENIERAIKKGTGELAGESLEAVNYEGYGAGGTAILVEALTDNRNRTTAEIRKLFERFGGKLGEAGCVNWLFHTKGLITVPIEAVEEDDLLQIALELGVEDVEPYRKFYEIKTEFEDFLNVRSGIKQRGLPVEMAQITKIPVANVELNERDGRKLLALLEALEDHDDVQQVYSNFELSEELVEELTR